MSERGSMKFDLEEHRRQFEEAQAYFEKHEYKSFMGIGYGLSPSVTLVQLQKNPNIGKCVTVFFNSAIGGHTQDAGRMRRDLPWLDFTYEYDDGHTKI